MQNKSIYLAIDNGIIAMDINRTLKHWGIGKIRIFSQSKALFNEVMYEAPPDLIIADTDLDDRINMYKLLERIRKKKNVPVVFISSEDSLLDANNFDLSGYIIIEKPFTEDILLTEIKKLLNINKNKNIS